MQWEYKRVNFQIIELRKEEFDKQLNLLGRDRWELVTAIQHEHHGYSHDVDLVFKRPAG